MGTSELDGACRTSGRRSTEHTRPALDLQFCGTASLAFTTHRTSCPAHLPVHPLFLREPVEPEARFARPKSHQRPTPQLFVIQTHQHCGLCVRDAGALAGEGHELG